MFWQSILIALESLKTNKVRSLLTMLGIIIGVGAVIAMVSIGMGVREKVEKSISSLGSNLLIVTPGDTFASGVRAAAGSINTLTAKDAQAIAKEVGGVDYAAPTVQKQFQVVFGNKNWFTSVQGATPELQPVRNMQMESGDFISNRHLDTRDRVIVLGKTVAGNLFGDMNPLGQVVRVNSAPFRVIGVIQSKGQSSMGQDQDDVAVIPLTTAQERLLGITHVNSISVQASSQEVIGEAQQGIVDLLRRRHRITGNERDDFTVRNLTALMSTMQETTNTITLLLGNTAAISLLVGGIGIMNIMLVSVTERTREIGIRKAIGATYSAILAQFLVEALVISIVGGVAGILLGVGSSWAISAVAGWNTAISLWSIMLAFGVSVLIGIFFGLYPARKAAKLDPIDALRYE